MLCKSCGDNVPSVPEGKMLENYLAKWKRENKRSRPSLAPDVPRSIKKSFGWNSLNAEGKASIESFWKDAWAIAYEEGFETGAACGFQEGFDEAWRDGFLKGYRNVERATQEEIEHDARIYLAAAKRLAHGTQQGVPLMDAPVATGLVDFPGRDVEHATPLEKGEREGFATQVRAVGG